MPVTLGTCDTRLPLPSFHPLCYLSSSNDAYLDLRIPEYNSLEIQGNLGLADMGKNIFSPGYSITHPSLGSDDPSVQKESEDLLSRFTRCPSNESQHASQIPRQNIPENPFRDLQRPSDPAASKSSQKPRIKIPRRNVKLRPQNSSRTANNPASMFGNAQAVKEAMALPPFTKKPPPESPPRRQILQSSSSSDDVPTPAVTRRSGRSRAEPKNYYRKVRISGSESEEETQDIPIRSNSRHLPQRSLDAVSHAHSTPRRQDKSSLCSLLQQRELGYRTDQQSYSNSACDFRQIKTWKGASNDVITLAWSPDGSRFAAGATAQCDEHMMAYNRKNNLLFGDLVNNELHELPDHWVKRPMGRGSASDVGDPRLFMSVTALQWFRNTLYTASYDHTIKLWDTTKTAVCYKTLKHESKVIVMARSNFTENLLATGTRTIGFWNTNDACYTELPRTRSRKDIELVPTSIAWGTNQETKNYLLAGMSEREDGGVAHLGLLAAYQFREESVEPVYFSKSTQNVFDVKWHPNISTFAVACTPSPLKSNIRSNVNIYQPTTSRQWVRQLDCPALDINEVTFCPLNPNYISASCTDGITYVWDMRNPDDILHQLRHGIPLNQLDETMPREQADTGVTMQSWGSAYDQLYTGASDGVLKRWNIFRAPEDVLVKDEATFQEGIMCGTFSPDQTNLLVGDSSGGVHLLSNSPFYPADSEIFNFKESSHRSGQESGSDLGSGVRAARELILSGQIARHPLFGPGKGLKYKGPFAAWARPDGIPSEQIPVTGLAVHYELRQLDGVSPNLRHGLSPNLQETVQAHISLAITRNQKRGQTKRRNIEHPLIKTEDHDYERSSKRQQPGSDPRRIIAIDEVIPEVIDLTADTDDESLESSTTLFDQNSNATYDDKDDLNDDFWWPDSRLIDPNWPKESD
ncbi:WD40-repeat-containing domain protein [Aspergillus californicus]